MKIPLFFLPLILVAQIGCAQLPPYVRNPMTTNQPPAMTNAILGIVVPDQTLSLDTGNNHTQYRANGYGLTNSATTFFLTYDATSGVLLAKGYYKTLFGVYANDYNGVNLNSSFSVGSANTPILTLNAGSFVFNGGSLVAYMDVKATNFSLTLPQWIGVPCMFGWSIIGPAAPDLTAVTNNSAIQELAFDNGDMIYATAHIPHTIAITNAAFPSQYITPIVHFSTVGTLDATHSNVTWRIEWEVSDVNTAWNRRGTNSATMGVTNNFTHYELSLGHITNDPPLLGTAVWRCRLMRPASALRDYSNGHDVLLDGFDMHVPVGNSIAIGNPND